MVDFIWCEHGAIFHSIFGFIMQPSVSVTTTRCEKNPSSEINKKPYLVVVARILREDNVPGSLLSEGHAR